MGEEIHLQDEHSNDSGRRANLALASTTICPIIASRCRAGRGTAGLGARSLVIAARLSDALALRNVGSHGDPRTEPEDSVDDVDRREGIHISKSAGSRPHGHGGEIN